MLSPSSSRRVCLLVALCICTCGRGGAADTTAVDNNAPATAWLALVQVRADLAAAVATGKTPPDAALKRLGRLTRSALPEGDEDADFADAALDVGQRLRVMDKPEAARVFFEAADAALTNVLASAPETARARKTQYLATRAFVRGQCLYHPREAKADIDAAEALSPNDAKLKGMREQLSHDNAAFFGPGHQD